MQPFSKTSWIIALISCAVLSLTFFIFFQDTDEPWSSLTAAVLSALLVLGALITLNWFIRVFKK